MVSLHDATAENHQEIRRAQVQLERSINRFVKERDMDSVKALTPAHALLISIKAEARLTQIIHLAGGLGTAQRSKVLAEGKAVDRWFSLLDVGFRRAYRVKSSTALAEGLPHDALAKRSTLHQLVDNELEHLISLRNKLAHGQWVYPLNTALTAIEGVSLTRLRAENTLTLKFRDNLLVELGSVAMELVSSGPGFEAGFERHFTKIRDNRNALAAADFPAWCAELQAKYVPLRPVAD